MIVTVTLNAAIDKTYTVANFATHSGPHRMYRPSETITVAGGKGINVARVLHTLEQDVIASGFAGGFNGDFILASLDGEGIPHNFTRTRGEARLCITAVDPVTGITTDLNEHGPNVEQDEIEDLTARIVSLLPGTSYLILSGSAPPGVPDDFLARLIDLARDAGVRTVLDSSGEHLRQGLKARPYMVKPNISELGECVSKKLTTIGDVRDAAKDLAATGIQFVLASMGSEGALVTDGADSWYAQPPEIEFVSPVGCGDSMVAAFVDAQLRGEEAPKALRAATAAAAANATLFGAGFCTKEMIEALIPKVGILDC